MKWLIFASGMLLTLISHYTLAEAPSANRCIDPDTSIGIHMMRILYDDLRIDTDAIRKDKIKTEIIENKKISTPLATQYAKEEYNRSLSEYMGIMAYKKIFSEANPRNLIIKFTYVDKDNKEDIFLVSAIVNDTECSVRFNGYLTVQREF